VLINFTNTTGEKAIQINTPLRFRKDLRRL